MSSKPRSKNTLALRATKLAEGARKYFPAGGPPIVLGGRSYTSDELASRLAKVAGNRADVLAAQATARAKVDAERAEAPELTTTMADFEAYVRVTFGRAADILGEFGLANYKVPEPMTAEQKAVAVAKRAATRKARNTMGPVQRRKAPKGNVTAEMVVTPEEPGSPV
jgi:hypothetical protein